MDSYEQKALQSVFAIALRNPSHTLEETNVCIALIRLTDSTFVLHVEDEIPALFLFVKYHICHPPTPKKRVLYNLLLERTPLTTLYGDTSMKDWIEFFEQTLGPILP